MFFKRNIICVSSIAALLLLSWTILSQGIHDQLLLDDAHNLAPLQSISESPSWTRIRHVVLNNHSSPIGRPVSMASFLIDGHIWPLQVKQLIRNNILFHILTGLCLLWFCLVLSIKIGLPQSTSFRIAIAVTTIWMFHPQLISTYLYAIQRMAVLSSALSLISLIVYLKLRTYFYSPRIRTIITAAAILAVPIILAIAAKENSFVIFSLIGLTEVFILSKTNSQTDQVRRILIFLLILSTPLALMGWLAFNLDAFAFSSQVRGFNLQERLLTQSRIIIEYLYEAFIPKRIGSGLFQDDIEVSRSLFSPITTLPSVVFVLGLIGFIIAFLKRYIAVCFGLAWFLLAHLIESSVIPLELKYEHRNYLPLMGLIFGLILSLESVSRKPLVQSLPYVFAALCILVTIPTVKLWSKPLELAEIWRLEHPKSARAAQHTAELWLRIGNVKKTIEVLEFASKHHPDQLSIDLQLLQIECLDNSVKQARVDRLLQNAQNLKLDFAIPPSIKALGTVAFSNNCDNLDYKTALDIVSKVAENPELLSYDKLQSETLYSVAGLYHQDGKYTDAAKYSRKAFDAYPDGKYALTETICWLNAGQLKKAEVSLALAKSHINTLTLSQEDSTNELKRLESVINAINKAERGNKVSSDE